MIHTEPKNLKDKTCPSIYFSKIYSTWNPYDYHRVPKEPWHFSLTGNFGARTVKIKFLSMEIIEAGNCLDLTCQGTKWHGFSEVKNCNLLINYPKTNFVIIFCFHTILYSRHSLASTPAPTSFVSLHSNWVASGTFMFMCALHAPINNF